MTIVWKTYKIYELGRVVTGKTPSSKQPELFGTKYPFITPSEMSFGERTAPPIRYLSKEGATAQSRLLLPAGSIAFVCIASIGKACLIRENSFTNQQINSVIVNNQKFNSNFIYYLLISMRDKIKIYASGTAVPIINKNIFSNIELKIPSLFNQRRIASILSAYDDLIENNTRRIAILEEMARRLYEEWFVHFRFPGHENTTFTETELGPIPDGWNLIKLNCVLNSIESGSRPKGGINKNETEIPSIGAENINGLANHDYSKEKFISQKFFTSMRRGYVQSGDVLLYKDGAHIGRKSMYMDGYPHEKCAVNEHVFILRTTNQITPSWLYFCLNTHEMTKNIMNLNTNAAQPGINQKGVKNLEVVLPEHSVVSRFDDSVAPLLAMLFCLAKKNKNLRARRDLLLPKLVSGEIDVSEAGNILEDTAA